MADATPTRSQAEGGILALAQNLETIHAVPVLAPVAEQTAQALENGHNSRGSMTATLIEETPIDAGPGVSARFVVQDPAAPAEQALLVLAEETLEIPVKQAVDSLVRPLVESVDTAEASAAEPPDTEAVDIAEPAVGREEPLVIAQPEPSSVPEATAQLETDGAAPASETLVPEPEPVAAAAAPSSEPEPLSQAGSPWDVTAIPELYVAAASWAHQIRELEQALETEAQSSGQELPGAAPVESPSETAAAPEGHDEARQSPEPEHVVAPGVLSAIEAPELAASAEVQEAAVEEAASEPEVRSTFATAELVAGPDLEEPGVCDSAEASPESPAVAIHETREPEPVFEAQNLTPSPEVQARDSEADASPLSAAVPEIDAIHETREPEPLFESQDLTPSPEAQARDSAGDAAPLSPAVPEIDAIHETREPEPVFEAQDLTPGPEVQARDSAGDASPLSAAVPEMGAIHETREPQPAFEPQDLAPSPEVQARDSAADAAPLSAAVPELDAIHETREPEPVFEAQDLTPSPEVQARDCAGDAAPLSPAVPEIDAIHETREPEPVFEAQDLTPSPEVQARDSAADAAPQSPAVPEIDATATSWADQIREAEQAFEPEVLSAIQDLVQPPPAAEALPEAEAPGELEHVALPATPALSPYDVIEQSEEPEPGAVAGHQLALDLAPDPEPPAQTEPFAQSDQAVSQDAGNEDAPLAGNMTALQSPSQPATQEPLPEPAIDARAARDGEATEALLGAIQLQAEALVDTIHAEVEAERAAIRDVAASFRQCGSTSLLAAPAEIVIAPAPPVFDWIRRPWQAVQPLPPPAENLVRRSARPQPLTLAGPCLAAELRNLAELQGPARSRKSRAFPGWVASLMGAMLLVLLAVTSLQYLSSQNDAKASTPAGQRTAGAPNSEALDKSVEISGLRLATSWSGKQQVRFLIVNHSAQDLSGVTLQVVVRSSDGGPSSAPILVIHAPLRSLGPYQSQEIKTALDSNIPASALSDWQTLRTDVQVLHGE